MDDAIHCVRSVAFRFRGKGTLSIDAIEAEMKKYQRVNDETYWDYARRFLTPEDIEMYWREHTR